MSIVTKFGGSSLADASQILKMKSIVLTNTARKFIVPSAPGKRFSSDIKITDMLYYLQSNQAEEIYLKIKERYSEIRNELNLEFDIEKYIDKIFQDIKDGANADYAASRGEYLNALLIADLMGWDFVDAKDIIFFDATGVLDMEKTIKQGAKILKEHENAVIPGFYGSLPNGKIKTFSRGGSDISGAIIAAATNAELYENWTDVSGFLKADPRIVKDAEKIDLITYRELRELSYMGATVLHADSIFPVLTAGIPINVRNTNNPEDSGTLIVPEIENEDLMEENITGIAGKKNFTVITIDKNGMNAEIGFGRKILSCLEKFKLPFEHIPSSIDTVCVVIEDCHIADSLHDLIEEIHIQCEPDSVEIQDNMALIATVGRSMIRRIGISAKLFTALAESNVNVRMIDQGSSEINIIVGVENEDFEKAVNAIYKALV